MTKYFCSALGVLAATVTLSNVAVAGTSPAKIREASESALAVLSNRQLGNAEGAEMVLESEGESFAIKLRNSETGMVETFSVQKEFDRNSWVNLKDLEGRFHVAVGPSPEGLMFSGDEFIKKNPELFAPRGAEAAHRKIKANFFTDAKRFQRARSLGERHQLAYDSLIQWCVEVFDAIGVTNWFAADWLQRIL